MESQLWKKCHLLAIFEGEIKKKMVNIKTLKRDHDFNVLNQLKGDGQFEEEPIQKHHKLLKKLFTYDDLIEGEQTQLVIIS